MKNNYSFVYFLFNTTREVIRADKLARRSGLLPTVITVPESLSSECGMCLRLCVNEAASFEKLLLLNGIDIQKYEHL